MTEGCSGTSHPVYERGGRKWVLFSVPEQHYHATGLTPSSPSYHLLTNDPSGVGERNSEFEVKLHSSH